jgi:hypothetical protein
VDTGYDCQGEDWVQNWVRFLSDNLELTSVIESWPLLPVPIRQAILTLVSTIDDSKGLERPR